MIKTVEVIVIIALIIFSFFLGVKYSESVKSRMSWLETQDEQEVELPDLSNENSEVSISVDEVVDQNAPALDNNVEAVAPAENAQVAPTPNAPAPVAPVQNAPAVAPVAPSNTR